MNCVSVQVRLQAKAKTSTYTIIYCQTLNATKSIVTHMCTVTVAQYYSPSIEKMKSLAVWISSARWSSYSLWSCLLNSWINRFSSSILVPDLKSSSGYPEIILFMFVEPGVAVGLFPKLLTDPARLESAGAAIFARNNSM